MHQLAFALKRAYYANLAVARATVIRDERRPGLTPARYDLLQYLQRFGSRLQSDLRRVLGVAKSTLSRMLRALEKHGWIVRERLPQDRRFKRVVFVEARTDALDVALDWERYDEAIVELDYVFVRRGFDETRFYRASRWVARDLGDTARQIYRPVLDP